MTFREKMDRYRAGTATPEERRAVEEELDKASLINDYLFGGWEEAETAEAPAGELKQVKKSLRRRNIGLVLTSVVLVAVMLLCIPLVEKQYFDPTRATWSSIRTDLNIALNCYFSLFAPEQSFEGIWHYTDTGFGTWELELRYTDWDVMGHGTFKTAIVEKNEINFPYGTLFYAAEDLFEMGPLAPDYIVNWREQAQEEVDRKLDQLGDCATVYAAVSFAEDLTAEELFELSRHSFVIEWAGVRVGAPSDPTKPLIGMSLNQFWEDCGVNADYPALEGEVTAENAEQHLRSMVEYVRDYEQSTMDIGIIEEPGYYDKVLEELDENGLRFYGCYMYTSPDTYRELAAAGYITEFHILDVQDHVTEIYFPRSFGG